MTNIVEVHDLRKQYGEFEAVKGLNFVINRGEIFGFLGPNGAGKTTTISMLSTLLPPTGGAATVCSFDLVRQPGEIKKRIGLVPQELALYPTLSARDNLEFFGSIYGLRGKELRERVNWTLELVGLADRAKDRIDQYSGGMKRRINIAAGLLHRPEILFLDEPTVGVDPQSRNHIFDNVERLNKEGLTILYTTHYMEEAERLCDRVAIVDQGRIIALDTPKALIDSLGGGIIHLGVNGKGEAVAEQARLLAAVKSIRRLDGMVEIETRRAQEALVGVLEVANRLDANVTSLEILKPNLETVFLHLTGKTLRD
ncbi:MAG TPA: ATP-binding cassette domain-containing protein [Anaerolineales bacterium]|nr:ATP-binding cassette domain-containing protein [Anaerolineales bacterium]